MPAPARWALGAIMSATGVVLTVFGLWLAVKLGPSGEAQFSATSKGTGAIVVGPGVLNAVDAPIRVNATRGDGGTIWMGAAPTTDARAVLATTALATVSGVHYPAGTLDLRVSGGGSPVDIASADVWRLTATGTRSAELIVGQGLGSETAVVTSGDGAAMKDVAITLTWANRAWFFEALAVGVIGAIIAAFALGDLWNSRPAARRTTAPATAGPRTRRSRVTS